MIERKLKICKSCKQPKFLFSHGLCNLCWKIKQSNETIRKRNKPIVKISKSQKERNKKYLELRYNYLKMYPQCQLDSCSRKATEIHHKRGRIGDNLFKYFLAVCKEHHRFIEENPEWAKLNGYTLSRLIDYQND